MTTSLVPEVSDLSLALRRKLRRLRKERGWSQDRLGQLIGADGATVSRIEQGRIHLHFERLERIATVLGCQVEIRITPANR